MLAKIIAKGISITTESTVAEDNGSEHQGAMATLQCIVPFVPHPWWRGGWMQTISIKALRPELDVDTWSGAERIKITDDKQPGDTLTGYFLPPAVDQIGKPTVIVFHGMGGNARSGYMRSMARALLDAGYPVILWNNRGAGASREECSQFHHPGLTDDIEALISHVRDKRRQWIEHGLHAVGFSLGANPMLRYLAEQPDCPIEAAVSISAPLDMEITSRNLRKGWNRLFDKYLLKRQRDEILRPAAQLCEAERKAIHNASSVWELDDQFTAKHYGYSGAEEYYQANSAIHVLDDIQTPTLLLHAMDDPVVDHDVFDKRQWTDEGPLFAGLAESGGHTGFIDENGKRWHESCTINFFDWQHDRQG